MQLKTWARAGGDHFMSTLRAQNDREKKRLKRRMLKWQANA